MYNLYECRANGSAATAAQDDKSTNLPYCENEPIDAVAPIVVIVQLARLLR